MQNNYIDVLLFWWIWNSVYFNCLPFENFIGSFFCFCLSIDTANTGYSCSSKSIGIYGTNLIKTVNLNKQEHVLDIKNNHIRILWVDIKWCWNSLKLLTYRFLTCILTDCHLLVTAKFCLKLIKWWSNKRL